MYNDYPIRYESDINQYLILYIIFGLVILGLFILTLISLSKIFKKANRSSISAIIPFYNYIVLLEITNLPKYYFILSLIPGVNIIFNMLVMLELSKLFRKSKKFGLGLAFLPFIFYPMLAFSDSEYIGINLVAKENKSTVVELPKIVNEEEKPVVNETFDDKNKNISISIGGGVYQKDYTNTLMNIDEKQVVFEKNNKNNNTTTEAIKNDISQNINNTFITNQPVINKPDVSNNIHEDKSYIENMLNNITPEEQINNSINQQINNSQPHTTNQVFESEFVNCPQCGATIKKSAGICFMCGKKLT